MLSEMPAPSFLNSDSISTVRVLGRLEHASYFRSFMPGRGRKHSEIVSLDFNYSSLSTLASGRFMKRWHYAFGSAQVCVSFFGQ